MTTFSGAANVDMSTQTIRMWIVLDALNAVSLTIL